MAQSFLLISLPSLGKYMPGKIFAFAGHSIIAKKFDVRISVSASVNLLMMGFGLASASLIGMFSLIFIKNSIQTSNLYYQGVTVCLIIIILTIIIKPEIFWKVLNWGLGILKQKPILTEIASLNMAILFSILFIQYLLYLLGLVIITSGTIEFSVSFVITLLGISCIAYVIGFLAIFAPAGIGVREGIFLLMLTPIVGFETAGLITIMTRLIQTICDCIFGVLGLMTLVILNKIL